VKPTEPGFYWVKTEGCNWFNGFAWVRGAAPYLYVHYIFHWADSHVQKDHNLIDKVREWGEKIKDLNDL
jgi:hypothetical protein